MRQSAYSDSGFDIKSQLVSWRCTCMEPLGIGLIGCGNVGGGVAKLLLEHPERMAARGGRRLELRRVVVRDLHKPRPVSLPAGMLTTELREVLTDPQIQVVVEVVGGVDYAKHAVLESL